MEELLPSKERKFQSRPRSSPSTRDTGPVAVRRPATSTSSSISGGIDLPYEGQDGGASLQARDETSHKQTIKENSESVGKLKSEALVHDSVRTNKVNEGWTVGDDVMAGYSSLNEQVLDENQPRYCKE